MKRVLVIGKQAISHVAFAFVPPGQVFANSLAVVGVRQAWRICCASARIHELWVRFFVSTMEMGFATRPQTASKPSPFPPIGREPNARSRCQTYYEFRAALMIRNNEGLTDTYNRFHDPNERSPDILKLRELHAAMDRAVLDAYGWTDISTDCDFFLDYEIDEETWGKKKRPYRYRWPDEVHDEVLARLLELNQKRYEEEVAAGLHDKSRKAHLSKASAPELEPGDELDPHRAPRATQQEGSRQKTTRQKASAHRNALPVWRRAPEGQSMTAPANELILYQTEDGRTRIECRFEGETLWLTQAQMAELFQTTLQNINLHLQHIYDDGEARSRGNYQVLLDSSNRGKSFGFSSDRALQPGGHPRGRLSRSQPSRHAVSPMGDRALVRVPRQGLRDGRRAAEEPARPGPHRLLRRTARADPRHPRL